MSDSPLGLLLGLDVLVVGVEDDPTETYDDGYPVQRVYIDARWRNIYCVPIEAQAREVRAIWDGSPSTHLFMKKPPPGALYHDQGEPNHG